eukprot:958446-Alexandrium_andersonii.AAC.1
MSRCEPVKGLSFVTRSGHLGQVGAGRTGRVRCCPPPQPPVAARAFRTEHLGRSGHLQHAKLRLALRD